MADTEDSKYPVGYKKPPRHTQFKPGFSGNVNGRPKGSKNFATVIDEELRAPIIVNENGRRKKISKLQAIVKQTVNRAAGGDPKATATLLNEARICDSQNQPSVLQDSPVGPEDQIVMDHIVQRIGQFVTSKPGGLSTQQSPSEEHPMVPTEPDKGKS